MTFFQIFSSIIGIGFILGGIKMFTVSKIWSFFASTIGIIVMMQVLFGEISKSDDKQNEIRNLKLESISEMLILPSQRRKSLSEDTLLISSQTELKTIQTCLSKTRETLRHNTNVEWGCILSIKMIDQKNIFIGISKKDSQTILELYSRGEYGVNYGRMINNELGFVIEDLFKKVRGQTKFRETY